MQGAKIADLDETGASLVAELRERGIATASFTELFAAEAWEPVAAAADRFTAQAERPGLEAYHRRVAAWAAGGSDPREAPENYLVRDTGDDPLLPATEPLFRLGLEPAVLDVVNGFFGFGSKLAQFDLSINFPPPAGALPRSRAHRWHRDRWEQVKVFLYFTDVDDDNGALEYIPASRRGERHAHLCPHPAGHGPAEYLHPPESTVEAAVPTADRVRCALPRGHFLFCDTAGLHRGGGARSRCRVAASWAYFPPAAQMRRSFRCPELPTDSPVSHAARYALDWQGELRNEPLG